jgi:hypothetical protein
MLMIALLALGTIWAGILAVVLGVCMSAAQGDRAAACASRTAAHRGGSALRLVA